MFNCRHLVYVSLLFFFYYYFLLFFNIFFFFFFFQAEDGIRDPLVTGVQTCALPIYCNRRRFEPAGARRRHSRPKRMTMPGMPPSRTSRFEPTPITVTGISGVSAARRSEERRGGKECRSGGGTHQ